MTSPAFEELDHAMTPLGELILRRRQVRSLDNAVVYEVKLDDCFLMSSLVNAAEIALADFALPLVEHDHGDVLVGGLGLGYTAVAALNHANVATVTIVEFLESVIRWHSDDLVPAARTLTQDPRCTLVHADFFAVMGTRSSTPPQSAGGDVPAAISKRSFHAILLDIDHSPQALLRDDHAAFYTPAGLQRLAQHLHPAGVFALWSADPPQNAFIASLEGAFPTVSVRESNFYNPLLDTDDTNYIILAQRSA